MLQTSTLLRITGIQQYEYIMYAVSRVVLRPHNHMYVCIYTPLNQY